MSWNGTARCYGKDDVEIEIEIEATFTDDGDGVVMVEDYTMPTIKIDGRELTAEGHETFDAKELGVEGRDWNAAISKALGEAEQKMKAAR